MALPAVLSHLFRAGRRHAKPTSQPIVVLGLGLLVVTLRVQVANNYVLGFRVIVIVVQVLGEYMIIGYLDP